MARKENYLQGFKNSLSKCNTVEELNKLANGIANELKEAHASRLAALAPTAKGKKTAKTEANPASKTEQKPTAKKADKNSAEDVIITLADKAAIKKLGLRFEKYSERAWALYGDCKPLRYELPKLKGSYNAHLSGGKGWVFSNKNVGEAANALGLKVKVS